MAKLWIGRKHRRNWSQWGDSWVTVQNNPCLCDSELVSDSLSSVWNELFFRPMFWWLPVPKQMKQVGGVKDGLICGICSYWCHTDQNWVANPPKTNCLKWRAYGRLQPELLTLSDHFYSSFIKNLALSIMSIHQCNCIHAEIILTPHLAHSEPLFKPVLPPLWHTLMSLEPLIDFVCTKHILFIHVQTCRKNKPSSLKLV